MPATTMKDKDAPTHPAPGYSQRAPEPAPASGPGEPVHAARPSVRSFLRARGLYVSLENVRVAVGIGLLVVAGVVAINVMVWHNAGQRIEVEAWRRLEVATDVRLADIDHVLDVMRREALSVARDPRIVSAVRVAQAHAPGTAGARALDELYSRAADFEFRNVAVLDGTGAPIGEWHPRATGQADIDREAAHEAVQKGQPTWDVRTSAAPPSRSRSAPPAADA